MCVNVGFDEEKICDNEIKRTVSLKLGLLVYFFLLWNHFWGCLRLKLLIAIHGSALRYRACSDRFHLGLDTSKACALSLELPLWPYI